MALRFCSRIDRRWAMLGLLAGGGIAVFSAQAPAVPAPDARKAYVAFFLGQGGYLFSWGIPLLASRARELGLTTDVFSYTDVVPAWTAIVRRRREGYKIALVGYSLGNTTATYLQRHLAVDLLIAISESSLGRNHPIEKKNTRRAVLWYGPDLLSSAGVHDGFDETNYVDRGHLLMDVDPRVTAGVLDELKRLLAPERRDQPIIAATAGAPEPAPRRSRHREEEPAPSPRPSASVPPAAATSDVTCTACWGFVQSTAMPAADSWMK